MAGETKKDKSKLSKRELDVLRAVAKGLSNQEIGRELVISENTVRVHLRKIYAKLEVQSRTEATMRAIQIGVIDMPGGQVAPNAETAAAAATQPAQMPLSPRQLTVFFASLGVALAILLTPYWRGIFHRPAGTSMLDRPVPTADTTMPVDLTETWQTRAQMPSARSRMGLAALDGNLYLIGGERTSGITGLTEIYTPATRRWQEGAGKPTAVANVQAVVIGKEIFVPGGCTSETAATSVLEIYNPVANEWRQGAPMPAARCAYAAAAVGDTLYVVGGWDGAAYSDAVFAYVPAEDAWQTLDAPYPLSVGFAAATAYGDALLVAGGYDGSREYADVFRFSPPAGQWEALPPLEHPRGGLGVVSLGDALYAVGGGWTDAISTNEQWSPQTYSWTTVDTPVIGEWRNLGLATIDRDIYAVGGWNGGYMDTVFSYKTVYKVFIPLSY